MIEIKRDRTIEIEKRDQIFEHVQQKNNDNERNFC